MYMYINTYIYHIQTENYVTKTSGAASLAFSVPHDNATINVYKYIHVYTYMYTHLHMHANIQISYTAIELRYEDVRRSLFGFFSAP